MAMRPSGRSAVGLRASASPPCCRRGSGLRARARRRLPVGAVGCGAQRSPGMGSFASDVASAGARFRSDAKAGGVARANWMRSRMNGERPGPSAARPPTGGAASAVFAGCARAAMPHALSSTSATVRFIAAGYTAVAWARGAPRLSRPCATAA
eukprot:2396843-Pleurochrysis_carterae.AAC.5